jgi:5'-hydroxyaverantin dehydrogenase
VAFLRTALDFLPRNEVDIYVPCAGLLGPPTQVAPAPPSQLADLIAPPADLSGRLIGVNLMGVFVGTMLVARYGLGLHNNPKPQPTKSIVLIASLAGYCGAEGSVEYTTTKFGIRGLLRGLRKQLAGMNVRLNAVAPFYVDTPMTEQAIPVLRQLGIPVATAEHVTEAVARLATDESAYGEFFPPISSTVLIVGRAIFVMPEGLSDGGDDSAGGQGGKSFSTEAFGEQWAVLVSGPMSDDIPA